ncbi:MULTISPECIES: hypothetical protein [unclassified Fusibacter]|uniref:hypothetical protein n=1 Tax=unclassified Fusibacter TaxID=2624464 RepID=UPI0013E91158|nr:MULTISPECIES: hypothetical protein [unclassified Fusibacter]MCK8058388.1 hypothetical protein [Fusibacter sp. A2]NPE20971.1 hypothetical protein [Fusibacter sp. A1]
MITSMVYDVVEVIDMRIGIDIDDTITTANYWLELYELINKISSLDNELHDNLAFNLVL